MPSAVVGFPVMDRADRLLLNSLGQLTMLRQGLTIGMRDGVVLLEHDPVRPRACPPHVRGSLSPVPPIRNASRHNAHGHVLPGSYLYVHSWRQATQNGDRLELLSLA